MEKCPNGCNLQGELIPEKDRQHFGTATHFSKAICVELPFYDGGAYYTCPDCKVNWHRHEVGSHVRKLVNFYTVYRDIKVVDFTQQE
jgi:hypothetical protein